MQPARAQIWKHKKAGYKVRVVGIIGEPWHWVEFRALGEPNGSDTRPRLRKQSRRNFVAQYDFVR